MIEAAGFTGALPLKMQQAHFHGKKVLKGG